MWNVNLYIYMYQQNSQIKVSYRVTLKHILGQWLLFFPPPILWRKVLKPCCRFTGEVRASKPSSRKKRQLMPHGRLRCTVKMDCLWIVFDLNLEWTLQATYNAGDTVWLLRQVLKWCSFSFAHDALPVSLPLCRTVLTQFSRCCLLTTHHFQTNVRHLSRRCLSPTK